MSQRPIFLFTFAQQPQEPLLPGLQGEWDGIDDALRQAHDTHCIECAFSGATSVEKLFDLTNRYYNRLAVFHFAGHANLDEISLQDDHFRADYLARILGMNKQLQLVFLNGCRSYQQATFLLERGVRTVIATYHSVSDTLARDIASAFYRALAAGKTIGEAFETARMEVASELQGESHLVRAAKFVGQQEASLNSHDWGLFAQEDNDLNWRLPDPYATPPDADYHQKVALESQDVNTVLFKNLMKGLVEEGAGRKPEALRTLWDQFRDPDDHEVILDDLPGKIYPSLPYPVVRYLEDVRKQSSEGRSRLKALSDLYDVVGRLLAGISLADFWQHLWEAPTEPPLAIPRDFREEIITYFDPDQPSPDHISLFLSLHLLLRRQKREFHLTPLTELAERLLTDRKLFQAYKFLEKELKEPLLQQRIPAEEVETLCLAAEWQLTQLLDASRFWYHHELISVADISVLRQLKVPEPEFQQSFAPISGDRPSQFRPRRLPEPVFPCNHAVMLQKRGEPQLAPTIFLVPFLIDFNQYINKMTVKHDLHFLQVVMPGREVRFIRAEDQQEKTLPADISSDRYLSNKEYKGVNRAKLQTLIDLCQEFFDDLQKHQIS